MATQYTPIYQFPYPQVGDPVKNGADIIKQIAEKAEQVLQNGQFPSANPNTYEVTTRLTALETLRYAEYTSTWTVPGGSVNSTAGTFSVVSAKTFNNNFANTNTPPAAGINLSAAGLYQFSVVALAGGSPGPAMVNVKNVDETVAVGYTSGAAWEYTASGMFYASGATTFRIIAYQTNSTSTTFRIRITKLA